MDIFADLEEPTTPVNTRRKKMTERVNSRGRDSSWGGVDLSGLLEFGEEDDETEDAPPPPAVPQRGRTFGSKSQVRERSNSRSRLPLESQEQIRA